MAIEAGAFHVISQRKKAFNTGQKTVCNGSGKRKEGRLPVSVCVAVETFHPLLG
jgi:hypothetical protein